MNPSPIRLLGISGSLRSNSSNTQLLRAAASIAPSAIELTLYEELDRLPHFNPDLDGDGAPEEVNALRSRIREADGLLLCTPEYAGGVPGALKNALDWLVSSGELSQKPVAVISASPFVTGGQKAQEALLLTLQMMSARVVKDGTMVVPFINKIWNEEGGMNDAGVVIELTSLLSELAAAAAASPQHQ